MNRKLHTGLGKGLSALLESVDESRQEIQERKPSGTSPLTSIQEIALDDIIPNPYQPRSSFDNEKIEELAESIKAMGIIQPITVTRGEDGKYQIISGERRFRASSIAGLSTIPAYIKEADKSAMLEMAIVENIQREDLDPIETALSFKRLIDECSITQEALAGRVGKNRATITNYLRLLKLPPEIQMTLKSGKISVGHAKALLSVTNPNHLLKLANEVIKEDLSVRETESLVQKLNNKTSQRISTKNYSHKVPESGSEISDILKKYFAEGIRIKPKGVEEGEIIIRYKSDSQLKKFLGALKEHNL